MISYREISNDLHQLKIPSHQPVLAHISNTTIAKIKGGSDTLLAALLATVDDLMVPTFTYQTMIIPKIGPTNNALDYEKINSDSIAEIFTQSLSCHSSMGEFAEKLRVHPQALRSTHPILSFSGVGVDVALNGQTLWDPWAPIQKLVELQGWVLLIGCDHTVNYTIHLAEALAQRKQFVRWGLTAERIAECPHFPGCSKGFNSIEPYIQDLKRELILGTIPIRAYPMKDLIDIAVRVLQQNCLEFLCSKENCECCAEIRRWAETNSQ
jgi:aminoglycoside 3-N-acetyltransferase